MNPFDPEDGPAGPAGPAGIEECIEEIEERLSGLERFAPGVLAASLAMHLEALLGTLHAAGVWSAGDVQDLLREIERSSLEGGPAQGSDSR